MSNKPDSKQLLELKARAHHLNPVVMIGQQGLTESVIKETDAALTAHELIKVRVWTTTAPNASRCAKPCAPPQTRN